MNNEKLKQYAELLVNVGINVKENEGVVIRANTESLPLVRQVVRASYSAGAKDVITILQDDEFTLARYENGHDYIFDYYPEFETNYMARMLEANYHRIMIGSPSLDLLKHIDRDKQKRLQQVSIKANKVLNKYTDSGKVKWAVAAYPSVAWAKKVFPDLSDEKAVELLWKKIFKAIRLDGSDPIEAWNEHDKSLKEHESWLDNQDFEYLKYEGPGTDLTVYLAKNHKWIGGSSKTPDGVEYMANIPTEEIFTTPHARKVDGTLRVTKPLSLMGNLISNINFVFKDGKVVDMKADSNQDILESMMDMDEGGRRLGEVAIVPHSSPISLMEILFNMTLFDENASCHFALGNSYAEAIIGGEILSEEERKELGANNSMIHIDFMVGGPELCITGYKKDGTPVPVLENGEWAVNSKN